MMGRRLTFLTAAGSHDHGFFDRGPVCPRGGERTTSLHSPKRGGFFLILVLDLVGVMSTWAEEGGHELRAELQITGQDTDHYFGLLDADRHDIENEHEFDDEIEWYNPTGVQQRKIYWRLPTDFGDRDLRTDQYRWLLERVEALHRILAPRVKALPVPE